MSNPWINLVVGVVGAITGGAASLAGSVLVNRWNLRRTARLRMYEELLPRVKNETLPRLMSNLPQPESNLEEREALVLSLHALERAAGVAGALEWECAVMARLSGQTFVDLIEEALLASSPKRLELLEAELNGLQKALRDLDDLLAEYVRGMWPDWRLQVRDTLRKLLRRKGRAMSIQDALKAARKDSALDDNEST